MPKHLGAKHISLAEIVDDHTTTYSKVFNGQDTASFIWDGTYLYIEKSSANHKIQRMTYSLQKKRNLLKFMSICTTDSYTVEIIGPFPGDCNHNDAELTKEILEKEEELMELFKSNPKLLIKFCLDRGFRDVKELLAFLKIEHDMPAFKPKGAKQLTTEQGNESRLVTKERGAVERYHGQFKRIWPFFQETIAFCFIPVIGPCLRVVTSVLNAFRKPPVVYSAEEEQEALLMLSKCKETRNKLAEKLFAEKSKVGPRNKSNWLPMDAIPTDDGFPTLTLMDIRKITCGPYHIKKAKDYVREHLDQNGDFQFQVCKIETGLLRSKVQSRHHNSEKYNVAVKYNDSKVLEYCCSCTAGLRNVGCCSHVTAIIWYLGYSRYHPDDKLKPRSITTKIDKCLRVIKKKKT